MLVVGINFGGREKGDISTTFIARLDNKTQNIQSFDVQACLHSFHDSKQQDALLAF
jgi:hypothetical protein